MFMRKRAKNELDFSMILHKKKKELLFWRDLGTGGEYFHSADISSLKLFIT